MRRVLTRAGYGCRRRSRFMVVTNRSGAGVSGAGRGLSFQTIGFCRNRVLLPMSLCAVVACGEGGEGVVHV